MGTHLPIHALAGGGARIEAHAGWGKDIPVLLENGDWSYNSWTADRGPKPDVDQAVCLACDKPAAATSYVFTLDKIK